MRERDLKTGQYKKSDPPLTMTLRNIQDIVRYTIHEYEIEQAKMKRPAPEKTAMQEIDHQINMMLKASTAILLLFAALYLAVNL